MVLVKVYKESDSEYSKQINADSYDQLKSKAEEKLEISIKKFLNKKSGDEIDDDDVLMEEIRLAEKSKQKLELIAIEASGKRFEMSFTF